MNNKGLLYAVLTALCFTGMDPVSKIIAGQVDPLVITSIRFLIGGLMLLPLAKKDIRRTGYRINSKDFFLMVLLGILCICVSMVLLQYAVKLSDVPAMVAILSSTGSVFTIILAALMLGEALTGHRILALLLCAAGVFSSMQFEMGSGMMWLVCSVGSSVAFSFYTVLSKRLTAQIPSNVQMCVSYTVGSLLLLGFTAAAGIPIAAGVTPTTALILLYLGVVVTGVGYICYFGAIKCSAFAAALVFFIKPVLAPFASWLINGIEPEPRVWFSMLLVLSGSFLCLLEKRQKTSS